VEFETLTTGLEAVPWPYQALPDLRLEDVDTRTSFLGRPLEAPLLIGAMTGGAELAGRINRNLAEAAQRLGLGMMLGSQRVMLEYPAARASFQVRAHAPDILLVGNLGVAQLNRGYGPEQARAAVEIVGADALALHTNPLQEAIQGGDTDFSGLAPRIRELTAALPFPVLLKEVGHGLSGAVAAAAPGLGLAALDVAGAGGTSWARVESYARYGELRHRDLVEVGIPTATALRACRDAAPGVPLVASGGIRTGLDVARSLALGASVAAIARPLVRPAIDGADAVVEALRTVIWELRVAMFAAGVARIDDVPRLP
jgi:isopentenyl-diphosphate delta-isomerase